MLYDLGLPAVSVSACVGRFVTHALCWVVFAWLRNAVSGMHAVPRKQLAVGLHA